MVQDPVIGPSASDTQKRLLLISCSASKKNLANKPALQVYDGPSYKILRKYNPQNLDVIILSARYGLIDAHQKISTYEQVMTKEIANKIRRETTAKFSGIVNRRRYSEIFIELGRTYQSAVDFTDPSLAGQAFIIDSGPIGKRLHNLKKWLGNGE